MISKYVSQLQAWNSQSILVVLVAKNRNWIFHVCRLRALTVCVCGNCPSQGRVRGFSKQRHALCTHLLPPVHQFEPKCNRHTVSYIYRYIREGCGDSSEHATHRVHVCCSISTYMYIYVQSVLADRYIAVLCILQYCVCCSTVYYVVSISHWKKGLKPRLGQAYCMANELHWHNTGKPSSVLVPPVLVWPSCFNVIN